MRGLHNQTMDAVDRYSKDPPPPGDEAWRLLRETVGQFAGATVELGKCGLPWTKEQQDEYVVLPSGAKAYVLAPDRTDIYLSDIAIRLSRIYRYGGSLPVTVSEHRALCASLSRHLTARMRVSGVITETEMIYLNALCAAHDDSEAYLGDIPRPFNRALGPVWARIEDPWDRYLLEDVYGLTIPLKGTEHHRFLKLVDNLALFLEVLVYSDTAPHGDAAAINWFLKEVYELPEVQRWVEFYQGISPRQTIEYRLTCEVLGADAGAERYMRCWASSQSALRRWWSHKGLTGPAWEPGIQEDPTAHMPRG